MKNRMPSPRLVKGSIVRLNMPSHRSAVSLIPPSNCLPNANPMKPERTKANGNASAKTTKPRKPSFSSAEGTTGPANGAPRLGLLVSNARRASSGRFRACLLRFQIMVANPVKIPNIRNASARNLPPKMTAPSTRSTIR